MTRYLTKTNVSQKTFSPSEKTMALLIKPFNQVLYPRSSWFAKTKKKKKHLFSDVVLVTSHSTDRQWIGLICQGKVWIRANLPNAEPIVDLKQNLNRQS